MKILVVGSGGREHAIAWRLAQDKEGHELYCAPGNAGTAAVATNVAIAADDIEGIAAWATVNHPDLVVVGPEAPLVKGLVDALQGIGGLVHGLVHVHAAKHGLSGNVEIVQGIDAESHGVLLLFLRRLAQDPGISDD